MAGEKTVLIVDDSATVRDLLSTVLKGKSFRVLEAGSGSDALKKLNGHRADIVITDIDMPDMNGIDLIKNLRKKEGCENIPVIVLSSLSPRLAGVEEKELDVVEWIEKPFSPRYLLSVIERIQNSL